MTGFVRTRWRIGIAVVAVLTTALGCIVFAGQAYVASRTPVWIAMLKDSNPDVRRSGALYLNEMSPPTPAVLDALMGALADEYVGVRQQAAHGLGKFGAEARQALPLLKQALNDPDAHVRTYAEASLRHIEGS